MKERWREASASRLNLREKEASRLAVWSLLITELYNSSPYDYDFWSPPHFEKNCSTEELRERLGGILPNDLSNFWEEVTNTYPGAEEWRVNKGKDIWLPQAMLLLAETLAKGTFANLPALISSSSAWKTRGGSRNGNLSWVLGKDYVGAGRVEQLPRLFYRNGEPSDFLLPSFLIDSLQAKEAVVLSGEWPLLQWDRWQRWLKQAFPHLIVGSRSPFDPSRPEMLLAVMKRRREDGEKQLNWREMARWLGISPTRLDNWDGQRRRRKLTKGLIEAEPDKLRQFWQKFLLKMDQHLVFRQPPLGWENLAVLADRLGMSRRQLLLRYQRSFTREQWEQFPRLLIEGGRICRLVPVFALPLVFPELQEKLRPPVVKAIDESMGFSEGEGVETMEELIELIRARAEERRRLLARQGKNNNEDGVIFVNWDDDVVPLLSGLPKGILDEKNAYSELREILARDKIKPVGPDHPDLRRQEAAVSRVTKESGAVTLGWTWQEILSFLREERKRKRENDEGDGDGLRQILEKGKALSGQRIA